MRIIGIDPGSAVTGYGVIDSDAGNLVHVAHGTLRPPIRSPMSDRLCFLHDAIEEIVRDFAPDTAVVEQVFVSASARSALVLGQARGVALAALGAGSLTIVEFSATRIKKTVTGSGRAGKRQVQNMVRRLLALDRAPASDAADALAAAICHGQAGRLGVIEYEIQNRRGSAAHRLTRAAR